MYTYSTVARTPSKYAVFVRPVPNSVKFRENIETPWKWANSAARLKIPCSVENCGP